MTSLLHIIILMFISHAQSGYVGGDIGVTDAGGPVTPKEVEISFGGRAGWLFYGHVGIGGYIHYYHSKQPTEQIAYLPTLVEAIYYPWTSPLDGKNVFHVSALFGTTQMYIADTTGRHDETATTFGWTGGYSLFIDPRYTLGPEFQYFYVFGDNSFKFWNMQLSFKMFF